MIPNDSQANLDFLKVLRDTDSLVCLRKVADKRKRAGEASGGATTEQQETIEEQKILIDAQSERIIKMQEDIEELRRQLNADAESVSSEVEEVSVSPESGRIRKNKFGYYHQFDR